MARHAACCRDTAGLTLVELLVALSLMAVIAALSLRGLEAMVRTEERTRTMADELLALQAGLAQWGADLDAVVQTPQLSAIDWDGRVLRITRRSTTSPAEGVLVAAWTRRGGSDSGQWLRWQSPPMTTRGELLLAWEQAGLWAQNPGDEQRAREVRIAQVDRWELFYFRSDAWTNPLSSDAGTAAATAAAVGAGVRALPDGVRLVMDLAPGGALAGAYHARLGAADPRGHAAMRARARGAVLLAAMVTVTLVATFAASALWQQWRAIEIEESERSRIQSGWVLNGALDWARLILREDNRSTDHLAEPWAVPLQESRLSTFLSADASVADDNSDGRNAFLSGQITDLQARLNVRNLIDGNQVHEPTLMAFGRLFEQLGLPEQELRRLAENLRFAIDNNPDNRSAAFASLTPASTPQLIWLGLSPASVAALQPYVTVLPARAALNINTAPAMVLAASVPGLDLAGAQRLVAQRERAHFRSLAEAARLLPGLEKPFADPFQHSVNSRFFEVLGRLRLDRLVVEERTVVQREETVVRTLVRERGTFGWPAGVR